MKTAKQILIDKGIDARRFSVGSQSTKCPKCSSSRRKKNARCLGVKIDDDGVTWFCHHCNDSGGEYYDSQKDKLRLNDFKNQLTQNDYRRMRNVIRTT